MSKEFIDAKKVTIDTKEEKIIYDSSKIKSVFKTSPDSRGRLHLGTQNRVIVIELKEAATK